MKIEIDINDLTILITEIKNLKESVERYKNENENLRKTLNSIYGVGGLHYENIEKRD